MVLIAEGGVGGRVEIERLYEIWRERFGQGWGQSWFLGAALAERYGARCGVTLAPLHHEGVGWYGLVVQVLRPDGGSDAVGRITASGDVERWGEQGTQRIAVDGASPSLRSRRPQPTSGSTRSLGASGLPALMAQMAQRARASTGTAFDWMNPPPLLLRRLRAQAGPGGGEVM